MSKKILILGGSGLLGQTLAEFLDLKNYIVTSGSRNPIPINKHIQIEKIDILDKEGLDKVIQNYDIVVNCTGQITNPIFNCYQQNTLGIQNIIYSVKKHKIRLIHISSVSVYGSSEYVDETSELNPETTYGTMKGFAEFQIEKELEDFAILRVSNLYGQNQKKGIINYLTKSFQENEKKIYFNNNGELKRYYLTVSDLSEVIYNIILNENINGYYNIIGDKQYNIKELVSLFEKGLSYKFDVEYTNSEPYDNIGKISDEKIKSFISLKYSSLEDYIRSLVK